MLARNFMRFLFGLILLSNAANLIIFASGRMTPGAPALVPYGADTPLGVVGNALPQALVLTAIVIGFGLLAFTLALAFEAYPPPAHDGQPTRCAMPSPRRSVKMSWLLVMPIAIPFATAVVAYLARIRRGAGFRWPDRPCRWLFRRR
jgi:multisubunit Na+/H+ antiporter MnhC subunit